ncbi:hypothetical protein J6590_014078 [Homalodisca vitripennis]|nr:hypothetical protein J6590_014078 [Homalodisca vitripennis]
MKTDNESAGTTEQQEVITRADVCLQQHVVLIEEAESASLSRRQECSSQPRCVPGEACADTEVARNVPNDFNLALILS